MNPGQGFRTQGRGGFAFFCPLLGVGISSLSCVEEPLIAPMVSKTGINLRITEKSFIFVGIKKEFMDVQIEPSWKQHLAPEFEKLIS